MAQRRKQTETDERKKVPEGGKETETENNEPVVVNSEATSKGVQEEGMTPEKTEVAEPASVKLNSNEGVAGGQKQEETNSADKK